MSGDGPSLQQDTRQQNRVLFIGDCFVDIQCGPLTSLPQWGEDRVVSGIDILPGGSVCNTARQYGSFSKTDKSNTTTYLSTDHHLDNTSGTRDRRQQDNAVILAVALDKKSTLGNMMETVMAEEGTVDLLSLNSKGKQQASCVILPGAHDRAFVSCSESNHALTFREIFDTIRKERKIQDTDNHGHNNNANDDGNNTNDHGGGKRDVNISTSNSGNDFVDNLKSVRHVHIGGYFCCFGLHASEETACLAEAKRKYGFTVSMDTQFDASKTWSASGQMYSILRLVDIYLGSESEAIGISNTTSAQEALPKLVELMAPDALVIIKCGARGCIAQRGSEVFSESARESKVVDTTGAGDAFDAAFLYQHLKDQVTHTNSSLTTAQIRKQLKFANIAGGLTVARVGACVSPLEHEAILSA